MEWTEASALECCRRNKIRVDLKEKKVYMAKCPGLKLWGAIDYLVHYCKYKGIREWLSTIIQ